MPTPSLPYELYSPIATCVQDKSDLVSLSASSLAWKREAEGRLWESTVLIYDDPSKENRQRLEKLVKVGWAVKTLEMDYVIPLGTNRPMVPTDPPANPDGLDPEPQPTHPIDLAAKALRAMINLEQLDIYANTNLAAEVLAIACNPTDDGNRHSDNSHMNMIFTHLFRLSYAGPSSPPIHTFLNINNERSIRHCPNLRNLKFSHTLEPSADYYLLQQPWNSLTTFSGNILHSASLLLSGTPTIRDVTVHLNPTIMSLRQGWESRQVPLVIPSVVSFGIGDLSGYPPFHIDLVLSDLAHALSRFPNLRRVRRVPFHDKLIDDNPILLNLLSRIPSLQYVSFMDYNGDPKPERGLKFSQALLKAHQEYLKASPSSSPSPPQNRRRDSSLSATHSENNNERRLSSSSSSSPPKSPYDSPPKGSAKPKETGGIRKVITIPCPMKGWALAYTRQNHRYSNSHSTPNGYFGKASDIPKQATRDWICARIEVDEDSIL